MTGKRGAALVPSKGRVDLRFDRELSGKFGRKLRTIRERLGVTQMRLAECAELTRAALSNMEAGRALPSLPALYRMANALALEPRELLP